MIVFVDNIDWRTAQVYGIYGYLGGGKTLTAVEIACNFLDLGMPVATNILLKRPYRDSENYHFIEDLQSVDWWKLPQGAPRGSHSNKRAAIIIDEAAEYFNQFSSTSPQVSQMLSWLRHSSKRGQFVFMIIQRPEFLVKSARSLCHSWIICTDLRQFRIPVLRLRLPFCGDLVMRRIFDNYGNLLSRGLNTVNKYNYGRFYDTAQILNHDEANGATDDDASFDLSGAVSFFPLFACSALLVWLAMKLYAT